MPTRRSSGGTQAPAPLTARSATSIAPASGRSNPATRRSSVVFPHPDGPRSATTSPRSTQSEAWSTATTSPKRFVTPSRRIIEHAM